MRSWAWLLMMASLGVAGGCSKGDLGAEVWNEKCASCHGKDGRGATKFAEGRPHANLTDGKWKFGGDPATIRRVISNGDPTSPMPAFGERLSSEELDAVSAYVSRLAASHRPGK